LIMILIQMIVLEVLLINLWIIKKIVMNFKRLIV